MFRKIALISLLLSFLFPFQSFGATKLLDVNLDHSTSVSDVAFDEVWRATLAGSLQTASPSPQGGQYVRCIINSPINNMAPGYGFNRLPGTKEVYWKQWMRIDPALSNGSVDGIKFVMINDSTETGQIGNWIYVGPDDKGIVYVQSTGGDISWWIGASVAYNQGSWVLWEFYVKANSPGSSNGIVRVWQTVVGGTRTLLCERTNLNMFGSIDVRFKTIGAAYHFKPESGPITGYVDIDGFEIWDGMPDASALGAPTGLKIVN